MKNVKKLTTAMLGAIVVLASCEKAELTEPSISHASEKAATGELISASVDTLDFGLFAFGSTNEVEKTITITNISDVKIVSLGSKMEMAALTNQVKISGPIEVGGSKDATIKFRPNTSKSGVKMGTITFTANDTDVLVIPAKAVVEADPNAQAELQPERGAKTSIKVAKNEVVTETFTIKNVGDVVAKDVSVAITAQKGKAVSVSIDKTEVAPEEEATVTFVYQAPAVGLGIDKINFSVSTSTGETLEHTLSALYR